jgi:hypothetical protein
MRRGLAIIFLNASFAVGCGNALATQEGTTAAGYHFATGGVSSTERAELRARRGEFTLWISTAARRSGALLGDVQVTVSDARHRVVYEGPLDGPWLLLDLPAGRYDVQARIAGQWQTRVVMLQDHGLQQTVFQFDIQSDVLPPGDDRRAP